MNDELIAKTPIGEIVVGIKSDHDYPGIFVELRGEHLNDRFKEGAVRLAWVEYSSDKQCLQTIAYGDGKAEAEERAFCEEQNRLSEQAVQEAIRTIKDGGVLQNQTVKFYRSRYRCNAFSIVNYLMRKYGVNVPLRTQGWINEKLTSVTIENGKCEHLRYMRAKGAQCSQRFFDCMSELIHNVCAETEG